MPCYHPVEVAIRRKSFYSKAGVHALQVVPCGTCVGCRAEQARQWAVRMMHESRMHHSSVFVTLTYDDRRMPANGSLCPKDFQGFLKRLRKTQERSISFYGCGEYGERTGRAHYHALLFGVEFLDCDSSAVSSKYGAWRSQALDNVWAMGRTEGGSVTMASASYVAGYIGKKVRAKDYARANPATGELLEPEFARMSLRPAIGKRWIREHWSDVYPRDFVVVDGYKAKPPRYYDKFMDQENPELMETVRQRRCDQAVELSTYSMNAAEMTHVSRLNLYSGRDAV